MDAMTVITGFPAAREAFILNRQVQGRSRLTMLRYQRILGALPDEWWPPTRARLHAWLEASRARGLQASTLKADFALLTAFCHWAVDVHLLEDDPTHGIHIQVPRRLPRVPSDADVQALLVATTRTADAPKWRAMFLLFIDTGMRLSECCWLRWEDVNFGARAIEVRNAKGSRDRMVYYGAASAQALQRYVSSRGLIRPEDWMWTTRTDRPIPRQRVDEQLRSLSRRAGLPQPVSAHRLRHYFATTLLRRGADLESVRQLLGHSSLAMTQQYLRLVGTDLVRAHRRASPADWLGR